MTLSTGQLAIAALVPGDRDDVARIFADGIPSGVATFETEVPTWDEWDRAHLAGHRLLAREHGVAVGWAALAPVSARPVYAGVAEVSVYVAAAARGRRVGTALLAALVESSEAGVAGGALFVLLFVTIIVTATRRLRLVTDPSAAWLAAAIIAGLVGFLVSQLADFSHRLEPLRSLIWMNVGLMFALLRGVRPAWKDPGGRA